MELDEIDYKILSALLQDGRKPARDIADEAGKHLSTITRRLKILEQEEIIKSYTALLNYESLGLELTVITELIFSKGKLFEAEREIATIPGVCAVYDVTGRVDALVIAKFRNRDKISEFTKKLLAMPFVERTETFFVLNTIKEDFRLHKEIEKIAADLFKPGSNAF
ncbi:MAG: Lrp/AsnC family transcriptional regulator [Candidatus Hodarchaeota archaeon]